MSHIWVRDELVRPADLAVLAHELICHRAWDLECLSRCVIEIEADSQYDVARVPHLPDDRPGSSRRGAKRLDLYTVALPVEEIVPRSEW